MKVIIFDHYGLGAEPQTFEGTPLQIEQQVRAVFGGLVEHIPFGDVYEMLRTLERMTGIECSVEGDETKPLTRIPRRSRERSSDPWMHELDMPDANRNL